MGVVTYFIITRSFLHICNPILTSRLFMTTKDQPMMKSQFVLTQDIELRSHQKSGGSNLILMVIKVLMRITGPEFKLKDRYKSTKKWLLLILILNLRPIAPAQKVKS